MALGKRTGGEISTNQLNFITAGTYLEGTIETKGSLKIDGKVKGLIKVADEIRVGKTGEIIGEVYAKTAHVAGKIEGNLYIDQKLTLQETSSLNGNLSAGKLIIDEGAHFNGKSEMGSTSGVGVNGKKNLFEKQGAAKEVARENIGK